MSSCEGETKSFRQSTFMHSITTCWWNIVTRIYLPTLRFRWNMNSSSRSSNISSKLHHMNKTMNKRFICQFLFLQVFMLRSIIRCKFRLGWTCECLSEENIITNDDEQQLDYQILNNGRKLPLCHAYTPEVDDDGSSLEEKKVMKLLHPMET